MHATSFHYYAVAIPVFLLLLAAACTIAGFFLRAHRYLLRQATSYALVTLAFATDIFGGTNPGVLVAAGAASLYLLAAIYAARAIAMRMGRAVQFYALWAIGLLMLGGIAWYTLHTPDPVARKAIVALSMAMVLTLVVPGVWRAPQRHSADRIAVTLFTLATLLMWLRPVGLLTATPAPLGPLTEITFLRVNLMVLLAVIAMYTAALIACALADSTAKLRAERDHDGLTNLINRRALEEVCTPTPYARGFRVLVMCDLDRFKGINDQYGHAVGDEVLRQFGHILQSLVREADVTARLGGDEFVLALKHTTIEHAKKLIARIQAHMARTCRCPPEPQRQVTASFGMVRLRAQEHLEESLQRADQLMYLAKKTGRNCLRVEGETTINPDAALTTA